MALSFTDKLRLQGAASSIKSELKAGTLGFMDKLKKQAEWKGIIDQLKGEATPPAPAPKPEPEPSPAPVPDPVDEEGTDEEAAAVASRSLVGFRLAGVNHPSWALKYEGARFGGLDLVVSNDQTEVAILWNPASASGIDAFLIAWPRYTEGTSRAGEAVTLKAKAAWDGIKSPFPQSLRKKVRYMVGQAEKEVDRVLKNGVGGFSVIQTPKSIHPIQIADADGVVGAGSSLAMAYDAYRARTHGKASLLELAQEGRAKSIVLAMAGLLYGVTDSDADESTLPTVAEFDAIVDSLPEGSGSDVDMENLAKTRAELVAALGEEPVKIDAGGVSGENEGEGKGKSSASVIERFIAGEFNKSPYPEFRQAVVDVDSAGAEFSAIQAGAVAWVNANPDAFNQAA